MAADLIIAPEAEEDLSEAYGWYEERRFGLGEEFLGAVRATISEILRMPTRFRKVKGEYRRALVRRFPYVVFYEYDAETVTVYYISHSARDTALWNDRLP